MRGVLVVNQAMCSERAFFVERGSKYNQFFHYRKIHDETTQPIKMLDLLPVELKQELFKFERHNWDPHFNLRYVNRDFLRLHNEVARMEVSKFVDINTIDRKTMMRYQRSFDFWNGPITELLQPEINWSLVLALIRNRRVYFEMDDLAIQKLHPPLPTTTFSSSARYEPDFEVTEGTLKLNNVQAFYYEKSIKLPKGVYNFQVGVINHRLSKGLGTTTFQISNQLRSYPSTFINELIPEGALSILNLSQFEVTDDREPIEIIIEEIGMYPKTNLEFCFIHFNPFVELQDYMFYTIPNYKLNKAEKLAYMNIQGMPLMSTLDDDNSDYKAYYEDGERSVKMMYPMDQRQFKERTYRGSIVPWKVPF